MGDDTLYSTTTINLTVEQRRWVNEQDINLSGFIREVIEEARRQNNIENIDDAEVTISHTRAGDGS